MLRLIRSQVAFASLALLMSCNKDKDPAIPQCFVTTIKAGTPTEYNLTTFSYSDDNKLASIRTDSYSNGSVTTGLSSVAYGSKGNIIRIQSDFSKEEFSYDASDRLSTVDLFDIAVNTIYGRFRYEYNASGQLISKRFFSIGSDGQESASFYSTYEYAGFKSKNPSKRVKHYVNALLDYTILYEYDNKRNPFESSHEFKFIFDEYFSDNNIVKQTNQYPGVITVSTSAYTYVYNDKGFPTSVSTDASFSTQYTYNCK